MKVSKLSLLSLSVAAISGMSANATTLTIAEKLEQMRQGGVKPVVVAQTTNKPVTVGQTTNLTVAEMLKQMRQGVVKPVVVAPTTNPSVIVPMIIKVPAIMQNFQDDRATNITTANAVFPFFQKVYADDTQLAANGHKTVHSIRTRWVNGQLYTVNRYNHGSDHGLMHGFISQDIVNYLCFYSAKHQKFSFSHPNNNTPNGDALANWAVDKVKQDVNFYKKVMFASSFQRTGRESETSGQFPPTDYRYNWYMNYVLQDGINFVQAAVKYTGPQLLFADMREVLLYKDALTMSVLLPQQQQILDNDSKQLHKILWASHLAQLIRIPAKFATRDKVFDMVKSQLFDNDAKTFFGDQLLNNLINQASSYLHASGHKSTIHNGWETWSLEDQFFNLSNNPNALVDELYKARIHKKLTY